MRETDLVISPGYEVEITTEASVWRIRADETYQRAPRATGRRGVTTPCLDDALDDLEWHHYEHAWWQWGENEGELRVRLLPVGRPEGSIGIVTGPIKHIDPPKSFAVETTA